MLVGWDRELKTFYAYVFDRVGMDGEPLLAVGDNQQEIPTISELESRVGAFARLNGKVISTLRHEASPLTGDELPAFGFE